MRGPFAFRSAGRRHTSQASQTLAANEAKLLSNLIAWTLSKLRYFVWSVNDVLPPYRTIEGYLETKASNTETNKFYIWVASTRIEVDSRTFELLIVGENMRVMCTKSHRAINIDRIIPGSGPG